MHATVREIYNYILHPSIYPSIRYTAYPTCWELGAYAKKLRSQEKVHSGQGTTACAHKSQTATQPTKHISGLAKETRVPRGNP